MEQGRESWSQRNRQPDFIPEIPAQARCGETLSAHKAEVISTFEREARSKVPAASDKEASVIINSLSEFLEQLVKALSHGASVESVYQISKTCEKHGKQRAILTNYTLDQVLFEYALLRRILLSTLRAHTEITVEESDIIHEAIEEGMIQAGTEFTKMHAQARELLETEKQDLKERADHYNASLEALLASAPVGIAFLDRDLRYIQVNKPLAELNGAPIEAHIGREVREMLSQDAAFLEPILKQVIESGEPVINAQFTTKSIRDPQREIHTLVNYFPVQAGSGQNIGIGAVVVDITELAKAREALRKSEELLRRIFESSEDCYKILDLEGRLLVLTEFSKRHLEVEDAGPLIGKSWLQFWSKIEDYKGAQEAVQVAATGGRGHFVGYYPTPSGKRKWWDVVITPMRNEEGKPERLLAISRDVTSVREAEEALKAAQEKIDLALRESYQTFKEMTDSLPVLFWWTDEGGKGNYYNKKFYEYTGLPVTYDPESKESFHPVIHPDDLQNNLRTRNEALRLKKPARFEERIRRWDGEYRWHLVHATPVFYENGDLKRWYANSIDIHEQKIAEIQKTQAAESLKTQTETLSTRNMELDRFAAIAAHDLKSPLNSIIQFSQILSDLYRGRLDKQADRYIDFIINAGKRMANLIDNLLEFARAGALDKSRLTTVNLLEVMGIVQTHLSSEIRSTNAQITVNLHLPSVHGKKLQMIQLFQNLVANAIKFHKPHQEPVIHIDFSDDGEQWCLSVADQGIGIDPKHSQEVFEIFNRAPGHQYEGSGIGLAVCKRIVEAHGGKIHFRSEPDRGTTFYLTLPKAQL